MSEPTVLIGTPTHRDSGMRVSFFTCLTMTERWLAENGIRSWWIAAKGCGVEWNRNKLVTLFLESPEATHLLFVDTDMTWSAKDVLRWIRADRDVVVGAALARRHDAAQWNVQPMIPPEEPAADGMVRVRRAGTGVMLIKRAVLERMAEVSEPYFETYDDGSKPLRRVFYFDIDPENREMRGEDFNFCREVQEQGFTVWCDPEASVGHWHEVPIGADKATLLDWLAKGPE